MKKAQKLLALCALMVSIGCMAQTPSPPLKTELPTITSAAPSPTPAPNPKPTETPAWVMPTYSPTEKFVLTQIAKLYETPVPIATPANAAADFKLQPWDADRAANLVAQVPQWVPAITNQAWADKPPFFYRDAYETLGLAAREAILRYPNLPERRELEWKIALADIVNDSSYSDEWLLNAVAEALNSGTATPETLSAFLEPHGLEARWFDEAANLFGDGQMAQLVALYPLARSDSQLFAAVTRDSTRGYHLIKIYSQWDFFYGYDSLVSVADNTSDGVPEVIIETVNQNGSFCDTELKIFQWYGEGFDDLGRGALAWGGCGAGWRFITDNTLVLPSIEAAYAPPMYFELATTDIYAWTDYGYELQSQTISPSSRLEYFYDLQWLQFGIPNGQLATAETLLTQAAKAPWIVGESSGGPSALDFVQFQLGFVQALQSKSEVARSTLTQLASAPTNPANTTLPQAAQAFLKDYRGDHDLARACSAALQVLVDVAQAGPTTQPLLEKWGYDENLVGYPCDLSAAFEVTLKTFKPDVSVPLPKQLQQAGVKVVQTRTLDLNADKRADWLVALERPITEDFQSTAAEVWAVLALPEGYVPLPVTGYVEDFAATSRFTAEPITTADSSPLLMLQAAESVYSFRVVSGNGGLPTLRHVLLYTYWGRGHSYFVKTEAEALTLTVFGLPNCPECQFHYRWNSRTDVWDLVSQTGRWWAWEEVEAALWAGTEVATIAADFQKFGSRDDPRRTYLLGLMHELLGEEDLAVQTYWQIWHDWPYSLYARLAQAKLRPND